MQREFEYQKVDDNTVKIVTKELVVKERFICLEDLKIRRDSLLNQKSNVLTNMQIEIARFDALIKDVNDQIDECKKLGIKIKDKSE